MHCCVCSANEGVEMIVGAIFPNYCIDWSRLLLGKVKKV